MIVITVPHYGKQDSVHTQTVVYVPVSDLFRKYKLGHYTNKIPTVCWNKIIHKE